MIGIIRYIQRLLPSNHRKKLFFLHIAKCGGISINRALRYRYLGGYERLSAKASVDAAVDLNGLNNAIEDDYESVLRLRENLLLYFLYEGHPFVSGHYAYSQIAYERFGQQYVFMTILRDPVNRFISSYFFNAQKEDDSPWKIRMGLEEFVETKEAESLGRDYVRLLGGLRDDRKYNSDEAIENAVTNLKKFDIVGIIEKPTMIEESIRKNLGIKVKVGHKNKNPVNVKERKNVVTDAIRERIVQVCRPSSEVYNAAKAMF